MPNFPIEAEDTTGIVQNLVRATVNIEKKHFKADCNEESGIMPRKAVDLMIQLASSRIIFCTPLAVPLVKTCIQNEN